MGGVTKLEDAEHLESLTVEDVHTISVKGVSKIGFTIKLKGDMSDDKYEVLRTSLESALQELDGSDLVVKSLKKGCILVTCEWLSGGAWELPEKVREALSDPTFELAGFPLLFEDGSPALKIQYIKVRLCASDECLQLLG